MVNYNDETYINDLVDKYKTTGDVSIRDIIIKEFEPYFNKYCYLLCSHSPVDITNKDTITFLRLWMNDLDRVTPYRMNVASKRIVARFRGLFKNYAKEDLYNDMVCFFIVHLERYHLMIANNKITKPRISFTHFIQINLRFDLVRFIKSRQKDALYCSYNVEYNDEINSPIYNEYAENESNTIDFNWVYGTNVGPLFAKLTESERYILYLMYASGDKQLSEYDVADILGFQRMSISRRMKKIRSKLEDLISTSSYV